VKRNLKLSIKKKPEQTYKSKITFVVAHQAKNIYQYRIIRSNLLHCNASVYFNQQCIKTISSQNTQKSKSQIQQRQNLLTKKTGNVRKNNIKARSRNNGFCEKSRSPTYSEWVCVYVWVALVIQLAKRMRRIILSSVVCLALPRVSTLSHKLHDFSKKLFIIKCVFGFSLQILSEIFLILRRIQYHVIINVSTTSCKIPVILLRI
jgi:hypothetical protein